MIHAHAKLVKLNPGQWIPEKQLKTQIVLHHTAGSHNASGVVAWWNSNKERVATPYIIDNLGKLFQCYDDEEFAYSLYVSAKGNQIPKAYKENDEVLNRTNIPIELTNAGWLTKTEKGFQPSEKRMKTIHPDLVMELDFRGQKYWETYTLLQIEKLRDLLKSLLKRYPLIAEGFRKQEVDLMFGISTDALKGRPGIYTHCSYRTDKTDVYPHPGLITMLRELQNELIVEHNKGPHVDNPFGL